MKNPTVGKSAEIDQDATRIFRRALPSSWLDREQKPDFHIDFLVEPVESGELTGKNFGVQIKGFRPTSGGPSRLKYSVKTKHLAYYLDKVEFPVFVLLVNTKDGTILYRFIQEYAKKLPSGWRSQKTVSVEFDSQDSFSDLLRFQGSLVSASLYIRDLHPSSVEASLAKLKAEIEAIDPRVAARVDVINGRKHFFLTPKENHTISLCLTNSTPENTAAFLDFIEKGSDLVVKAKDVKFENAPLFEKMTEGEIRVTHRAEVSGQIILSGPAGQESFHLQIPAVFWQGTKYISMRADFQDSPFEFETEFQPDLWNQGYPFTCRLKVNWEKWRDKPVESLSFFDTVHEFLEIFAKKSEISVKFVIKGNKYGQGTFGDTDRMRFRQLFSVVDAVKKVRDICNRLSGFAKVPGLNEIDRDGLQTIDQLHAVLFEGLFFRKISHATLTGEFNDDGRLSEPVKEPAPLTVSYPKPIFEIWGGEFSPGPIDQDYTEMRLISCKKIVEENAIQIAWKATPNSTLTVRRRALP